MAVGACFTDPLPRPCARLISRQLLVQAMRLSIYRHASEEAFSGLAEKAVTLVEGRDRVKTPLPASPLDAERSVGRLTVQNAVKGACHPMHVVRIGRKARMNGSADAA